ncbi:hypothetical protein ACFV1W_09510 [Kitasatospora sp. NPDC059648]|uniref:hypothetical protein n=1 Tax=Kitasatospora sp. NPDC059648 TaxID=3346894 RepID=UPI003693C39E
MPEDSAPPRDTPPPSKKPEPSPSLRERLWALARITIIGLGLALTVFGFVRFVDVFEEIHTYRAAPTCATPAAKPGELCAALESGRVTKRWTEADDGSTAYKLAVARETAPTDAYDVGEAFYDDVEPGTTVELKVLRGKVIEVSYHGHRAKPLHMPWLKWIESSALIGAGLALVLTGMYLEEIDVLASMLLASGAAAAVATAVGSAVLITIQWPLIVTLVIGVAFWLLAAYVCVRTLEDF